MDKRSEGQFTNVYHLDTFAANREMGFGKDESRAAARIPEAPPRPPRTLKGDIKRGAQWLGLIE